MTVPGGVDQATQQQTLDALNTLGGSGSTVDPASINQVGISDGSLAITAVDSTGMGLGSITAVGEASMQLTVAGAGSFGVLAAPGSTVNMTASATTGSQGGATATANLLAQGIDPMYLANSATTISDLLGSFKNVSIVTTILGSNIQPPALTADHSSSTGTVDGPVVDNLNAATTPSFTFDFTNNPKYISQTLVLNQNSGATVSSSPVANVLGANVIIASGTGTVNIGGNGGTSVVGDTHNQLIVGGAGADTMIGGGGNDTIVGGAGDTFGFNSATPGVTTINGLQHQGTGTLNDNFYFQYNNVTTVDQLNSHITHVLGMETWGTSAQHTTYVFDNGSSVDLLGVTANQVLAQLVTFTLNHK